MNNAQRIQNAITWIDKLLTTRMKQGQQELGNSKTGTLLPWSRLQGTRCLISPRSQQFQGAGPCSLGLHDSFGIFRDTKAEFEDDKVGSEQRFGLTELNDEADFTFKQIAKRIIDRPHCYFRPGVAKGIRAHYKKAA